MSTRHYVVLVKDGVDLDQFWNEMATGVSSSPSIPKRPVVVLSNWDAYPRMCDYELTPDEADNLKKDLRVEYVDVPHNQNPDVKVVYGSQQTGKFIRFSEFNPTDWPTYVNWGLVRHNNIDATNNSTAQYQYTLDGTGVDVVITDSGIQADHPDFNNLNGVSRIQQINWGAIHAPLANSNPYIDNDGHGTNVAGIAASNTYGWAKNSNVYAASGIGNVDTRELFEGIRKWHLSKPVDLSTGSRRPTVVNMSWGLTTVAKPASAVQGVIDSITSVNYRGETVNGPFTIASLILKGIHKDNSSMSNYLQREDAGVDHALDVLIDSGVIVCRCAMNNGYKIDVPGGQDYNNSFTTSTGLTLNYHRGFSPKSQKAITVGSIDHRLDFGGSGKEQKAGFSCAGPGVDVFAAGYNIVSTGSSRVTANPGYKNTSYKVSKMNGTSQASPQIAGMCALYLQTNPTATPAQVKEWIVSSANTAVIKTAGSTDYYNDYSLFESTAGVAYLKSSANITNVSKTFSKEPSGNWQEVKSIFVKQNNTDWVPVKTGYIKTTDGWKVTYKQGS